jgi:hypothetical protein
MHFRRDLANGGSGHGQLDRPGLLGGKASRFLTAAASPSARGVQLRRSALE